MIKFFRRIRQQLLSENKFTKYLIYAAGEIVLVVIGILIALQINDWNNYSIDREKEQAILKELNKEFKHNLVKFEEAKHFHLLSDSLLKLSLTSFPWAMEDIEKNLPIADSATLPWTYNPSRGVINSLISSGNYELIKNDSLRNLLLSFNDVYEDFLEEELNHQKYRYEVLEPLVAQNIDLMNMRDPKVAQMNLNFFNSSSYRSQLLFMLGRLSAVSNEMNEGSLENKIKVIVNLTSSEIKN